MSATLPPPQSNPPVTAFLQTRRSVPPKMLSLPAPSRAQIEALLATAARVPDHGRMEPWRFIVIEHAAMPRIAEAVAEAATAREASPEAIEKARGQFDRGICAVVVVSSPKPSDKIPQIEQVLSAGAVCYGLVMAALADGWGASWITGAAAFDRGFLEGALQLNAHENVAGIIHIGTASTPIPERPRPDVAALSQWLSE